MPCNLPAITAFVLLAASLQSLPPPDVASASALRPADPALSGLFDRGLAESETFRDLVEAIARLKGVVYVTWTAELPHRLGAALLHKVKVAPDGTRCVWIVVRRGSRSDLVPVLGHELQHAVEVLSSTAVTSEEIEKLFRRLDGRDLGPPYETRRAQEVQRLIREELRAAETR